MTLRLICSTDYMLTLCVESFVWSYSDLNFKLFVERAMSHMPLWSLMDTLTIYFKRSIYSFRTGISFNAVLLSQTQIKINVWFLHHSPHAMIIQLWSLCRHRNNVGPIFRCWTGSHIHMLDPLKPVWGPQRVMWQNYNVEHTDSNLAWSGLYVSVSAQLFTLCRCQPGDVLYVQ